MGEKNKPQNEWKKEDDDECGAWNVKGNVEMMSMAYFEDDIFTT